VTNIGRKAAMLEKLSLLQDLLNRHQRNTDQKG